MSERNGIGPEDDPYVGEYPGVCGGYPVIRNTRIPVRVIVFSYRAYGDTVDVAELYPHIDPDRIRGALDYYERYPARVDQDFERNERAWTELTSGARLA